MALLKTKRVKLGVQSFVIFVKEVSFDNLDFGEAKNF